MAEIEGYVEDGLNYLDACVHYCQVHKIEEESLAAFIKATKPLGLHGKLLSDAKQLNMMKK